MWEQVANHGAIFRISDWSLKVDAVDGRLQVLAANHHGPSLSGLVQLADLRLPAVTESFVRGDELHLVMPQTDDCQVGLELVLMIIEADATKFVLETVISLQTQHLDLHPRIVLSTGSHSRWSMNPLDTSRWYVADDQSAASPLMLSVLIDPRDRYSIDETHADRQQLSFFGDFMEKGVIRKVQPWWVWSVNAIEKTERRQLASELAARPLPLAT